MPADLRRGRYDNRLAERIRPDRLIEFAVTTRAAEIRAPKLKTSSRQCKPCRHCDNVLVAALTADALRASVIADSLCFAVSV